MPNPSLTPPGSGDQNDLWGETLIKEMPSVDMLRQLHHDWEKGYTNKVDIERNILDIHHANGKLISHLWRKYLHVETEEQHPMSKENDELVRVLKDILSYKSEAPVMFIERAKLLIERHEQK